MLNEIQFEIEIKDKFKTSLKLLLNLEIEHNVK